MHHQGPASQMTSAASQTHSTILKISRTTRGITNYKWRRQDIRINLQGWNLVLAEAVGKIFRSNRLSLLQSGRHISQQETSKPISVDHLPNKRLSPSRLLQLTWTSTWWKNMSKPRNEWTIILTQVNSCKSHNTKNQINPKQKVSQLRQISLSVHLLTVQLNCQAVSTIRFFAAVPSKMWTKEEALLRLCNQKKISMAPGSTKRISLTTL